MEAKTTADRFSFAMVGGGQAAEKAISALGHHPLLKPVAIVCAPQELLGVVDPSMRLASYSEVLDREDITAVYLATPVGTHVSLALAAAVRGKHVMIEKPLAATSAEGQLLREQESRVTIAVAFKKRFSDAVQYAKQLMDSQEPSTARFHWSIERPQTPWRHSVKGGGVLNDLGSHVLDLFEYLWGPIVALSATTWAPILAGAEGEVFLRARFRNNFEAHAELTWCRGVYRQELLVDLGRRVIAVERPAIGDDIVSVGEETRRFSRNSEYVELMQSFHAAVMQRPHDCPSLADGLRNLALIEACREAASTGMTVRLE